MSVRIINLCLLFQSNKIKSISRVTLNQSISDFRQRMPLRPQYTLEQRLCLYDAYTREQGRTHIDRNGIQRKRQPVRAALEKFAQEFPNARLPNRHTVPNIIEKMRKLYTLQNCNSKVSPVYLLRGLVNILPEVWNSGSNTRVYKLPNILILGPNLTYKKQQKKTQSHFCEIFVGPKPQTGPLFLFLFC